MAKKKAPVLSIATLAARVNRAVARKKEIILEGVENYHVRLMNGNSKTGENCKTVSLICGHDCSNCKHCFKDCYDARNVIWQPAVIEQRSINSAIHSTDPERYFYEISLRCEVEMVRELRFNVGGDFQGDDFMLLDREMKKRKNTECLFFTHNGNDLNLYLDKVGRLSKNVHALISLSRGQEESWNNDIDNRHNLPLAHIRYEDGSCPTLDKIGPKPSQVYGCTGNCSRCFWNKKGCPYLKAGQHMVFDFH